ncbi:MAG: hypothetical protein WDN04_13750 [Rhodospirillales bacterium]
MRGLHGSDELLVRCAHCAPPGASDLLQRGGRADRRGAGGRGGARVDPARARRIAALLMLPVTERGAGRALCQRSIGRLDDAPAPNAVELARPDRIGLRAQRPNDAHWHRMTAGGRARLQASLDLVLRCLERAGFEAIVGPDIGAQPIARGSHQVGAVDDDVVLLGRRLGDCFVDVRLDEAARHLRDGRPGS